LSWINILRQQGHLLSEEPVESRSSPGCFHREVCQYLPIGAERSDDTPERSAAEIVTILNQVVDLAHTAAQDLLAGPSRFSMLEV